MKGIIVNNDGEQIAKGNGRTIKEILRKALKSEDFSLRNVEGYLIVSKASNGEHIGFFYLTQ